jgi:hypothetical protein
VTDNTVVNGLPSFKDTDYTGILSTLQTLINYLFVASWILMCLVVVGSLVFVIILNLIS